MSRLNKSNNIFYTNFFRQLPQANPVEKDLFLTFSSQLKEFSTFKGENSCTNLDYFVICAQKYMLSGASVDVMCEHNAQVSEGAKRFQVAEAWVSRILFSILKVD